MCKFMKVEILEPNFIECIMIQLTQHTLNSDVKSIICNVHLKNPEHLQIGAWMSFVVMSKLVGAILCILQF